MIVFSALSNVPIFNGLADTLTACGENAINWNASKKPIYDMLEELRPEYLFIGLSQIDKASLEALPQYDTKLILFGANIPDEIKEKTQLLIVPQHVPDVLLKNIDGNVIKLKKAANIVQFTGGYFSEKLKSDLLYISNSASVSRGYISTHISGLISHLNYSIKVIGTQKLSVPQYIGYTNTKETLNFIKSTNIVLDYDWEIALDIVANESLVISNVKNDLMPYYTTEYELVQLIEKYNRDEKARRKTIKKAYNAIIDKDTYFHRLHDVATAIEKTDWQTKSMETLTRYRK